MSQINFPQYTAPIVDTRTGQASKEFWYFLQQVWNRTGGVSGLSSSDLDAFMQFDIREADSAEIAKRVDSLEYLSQEIDRLAAQVAEQRKLIDAMAQDVQVDSSAQVAELKKAVDYLSINPFTV